MVCRHKKGDDTTALVAHVKGIWNGEAAQLLKAQFLSSSTEPEVARPSERERSEAAPDVLAPLTVLALQLPICFKVRALSGGLVSSTPE